MTNPSLILPALVLAPLVTGFPDAPPQDFQSYEMPIVTDSWSSSVGHPHQSAIWRGFSNDYSSSSKPLSVESLSSALIGQPISSSSTNQLSEGLNKYMVAEKRIQSVSAAKPTENLFEIRRLTGYTWEKIATLLNVQRRTLYYWTHGREIRDSNREHIASTLRVLRFIDRGSDYKNATALENTINGELTAFSLIINKRYQEARQSLEYGSPRAQALPSENKPQWELRPMIIHKNASPDDIVEEMPIEAAPPSRPRHINRG